MRSSDFHRPRPAFLLEAERRVARVLFKHFVLLDRQRLHLLWKFGKQLSELPSGRRPKRAHVLGFFG
jgi:hypothetical protein